MTQFRKLFHIAVLILLGIGMWPAAAMAQNAGQLHFCSNGQEVWTARDASYDDQPGFFHQEIGVGDGGTYTITAVANGFTFDGFAYARSDARDDWTFHRQTTGARQFSHTFEVGDWGGLFLFQLVKEGNGCRGCTVDFILQTSNCTARDNNNNSSAGNARRGQKLCNPNYCYREDVFGLPGQCIYSPGADGYQLCK